jgi:hypothetical protein
VDLSVPRGNSEEGGLIARGDIFRELGGARKGAGRAMATAARVMNSPAKLNLFRNNRRRKSTFFQPAKFRAGPSFPWSLEFSI